MYAERFERLLPRVGACSVHRTGCVDTRTSPPATLRSATYDSSAPNATPPPVVAAKPRRAAVAVTVVLAAVLGAAVAVVQFEVRGGEIALTGE